MFVDLWFSVEIESMHVAFNHKLFCSFHLNTWTIQTSLKTLKGLFTIVHLSYCGFISLNGPFCQLTLKVASPFVVVSVFLSLYLSKTSQDLDTSCIEWWFIGIFMVFDGYWQVSSFPNFALEFVMIANGCSWKLMSIFGFYGYYWFCDVFDGIEDYWWFLMFIKCFFL